METVTKDNTSTYRKRYTHKEDEHGVSRLYDKKNNKFVYRHRGESEEDFNKRIDNSLKESYGIFENTKMI